MKPVLTVALIAMTAYCVGCGTTKSDKAHVRDINPVGDAPLSVEESQEIVEHVVRYYVETATPARHGGKAMVFLSFGEQNADPTSDFLSRFDIPGVQIMPDSTAAQQPEKVGVPNSTLHVRTVEATAPDEVSVVTLDPVRHRSTTVLRKIAGAWKVQRVL